MTVPVAELIKGFCLDFSFMGNLGEKKTQNKPDTTPKLEWVCLLDLLA